MSLEAAALSGPWGFEPCAPGAPRSSSGVRRARAEFGRTIYSQGKLTPTDYGRDHHPRCFSLWMAGGGVKGGVVYGETDEFSYNIIKDPVHIRDFQATLLHLFGIDHQRFTYDLQGLPAKLTGVAPARVVNEILA